MYKPLQYDPKSPADIATYTLDFTKDLDATQNESIVGTPAIATITTTGTASNLTNSTATVFGNIVSTQISGGVANTTCLVSFTITTSLANVVSRSVILPVLTR